MTSHKPKNVVHWFRKGLRLHDQPALKEGLANATTWRGIFIVDPWFAGSSNVGINKWRYVIKACFKVYVTHMLVLLLSFIIGISRNPYCALPQFTFLQKLLLKFILSL